MTREEILKVLSKLENFRVMMERGEFQAGSPDWVVRCCQAIVAEDHFEKRIDWEHIIKETPVF